MKDTGEGRNEYNDNPEQETETSSGACTTARKALTLLIRVLEIGCRVILHTEPTSSHNSN